jgi:hypothetical protein
MCYAFPGAEVFLPVGERVFKVVPRKIAMEEHHENAS